MTYSNYQNAADAVKDALISALNSDEETNTLSELWRHYLGLRAIADKASKDLLDSDYIEYKKDQDFWNEDGISLTGNPLSGNVGSSSSDTISFDAAQPVPMSSSIYGSSGADIITFN
jgi:hypothetical protein